MDEWAEQPAKAALDYLAAMGLPAERARLLVMGTGCGGRCSPNRPCAIRSLRQRGALVDFYDPRLPETLCGGLRARGVRSLTTAGLRRYDLVILQQPCPESDCRKVAAAARCVLDARPDKKDCMI